MNETEKYLRALLLQQGINTPEQYPDLFAGFAQQPEYTDYVKTIRQLQQHMTKDWQITARREDLKNLQIALPNGHQGKPYYAVFDFNQYGLEDITRFELTGFEGSGLTFNPETKTISGTPAERGDVVLDFRYNFDIEEEGTPFNAKKITIIINPDPKLLWKNLSSDATGIYAKPDTHSTAATLNGRTLLAASYRGRSHANRGGYRDDDYAYAELPNGWAVVIVSDGAGSAQYSRKGAELACKAVTESLNVAFGSENEVLNQAIINKDKDTALRAATPILLSAAQNACNTIAAFAQGTSAQLADFHTTLAFAVFKTFADTTVFLSFGVGDSPMALVAKDFRRVTVLNAIDSGDFGGGTRFITMPQTLQPQEAENRLNVEFTEDFPYLVLMTDGIFDPLFEVEAALANIAKWQQFFENLAGNNEEAVSVPFTNSTEAAKTLLKWTDFWSTGNHDDRTLALVF